MFIASRLIKKKDGFPVTLYMYKRSGYMEIWSVEGASGQEELLEDLCGNETIGIYKFVRVNSDPSQHSS